MKKTHFSDTLAGVEVTACRRGGRAPLKAKAPSRVDCASCKQTPVFVEAKTEADAAAEAAYLAQEPKQVKEPWTEGNIVCVECGGDLFRSKGRSCYGHYADYGCANCGKVASRLTETGRSF